MEDGTPNASDLANSPILTSPHLNPVSSAAPVIPVDSTDGGGVAGDPQGTPKAADPVIPAFDPAAMNATLAALPEQIKTALTPVQEPEAPAGPQFSMPAVEEMVKDLLPAPPTPPTYNEDGDVDAYMKSMAKYQAAQAEYQSQIPGALKAVTERIHGAVSGQLGSVSEAMQAQAGKQPESMAEALQKITALESQVNQQNNYQMAMASAATASGLGRQVVETEWHATVQDVKNDPAYEGVDAANLSKIAEAKWSTRLGELKAKSAQPGPAQPAATPPSPALQPQAATPSVAGSPHLKPTDPNKVTAQDLALYSE